MRVCVTLATLATFLILFTSFVSAATPTSFCKCICGSNSTIIPLNGRSAPSTGDNTVSRKTGTCTDCNRQFCLEYNLPICKNTKDEEITTECFQRDSLKDKMVVYAFILLTVGLLAYAAFEPYLKPKIDAIQERRSYSAVPLSGGNT